MNRSNFTFGLLLFLLVGCATPEYVKPESLAVPAVIEVVELQSDLTFKTDGDRGVVTLISGVYSSVQEDSRGLYFKGPAKSVRLAQANAVGGTRYYTWDGGFWMPKSKDEKPRVFTYPSSVTVSGDPARAPGTEKEAGARAELIATSAAPAGTPPMAAGVGAALGMGSWQCLRPRARQTNSKLAFDLMPCPIDRC
jgi:hypothetical protein